MPIIYTATIPINVHSDGTIDILSKIQEEVKKCGCIDVSSVSKQLNTSFEDAQQAAKQLAGDGVISCDPNNLYCCADEKRLNSFMNTLKGLRSE
jgi:hypothetical protein